MKLRFAAPHLSGWPPQSDGQAWEWAVWMMPGFSCLSWYGCYPSLGHTRACQSPASFISSLPTPAKWCICPESAYLVFSFTSPSTVFTAPSVVWADEQNHAMVKLTKYSMVQYITEVHGSVS